MHTNKQTHTHKNTYMAVAVTQRNDFSAQAVVSEIYETECVRERAGDLTLLTALLTLASPRPALAL